MQKTLTKKKAFPVSILFILLLFVVIVFGGCDVRPDSAPPAPLQIPEKVENTETIMFPYAGKLESLEAGNNLVVTNNATKIQSIHLYEYAIAKGNGFTDQLYILSNALYNYLPKGDNFIFALDPANTHKFIVEVYDYGTLVCREFIEFDPSSSSDGLQQILVSNTSGDEYTVTLAPLAQNAPPVTGAQEEMLLTYDEQQIALGVQEGAFPWGYNFNERSRESIVLDNEYYGTVEIVNCGDIFLTYLTNNDDGKDYLASIWSNATKLSTYRGLANEMSKEEFFANYSLDELGITIGKNNFTPYRFNFDDGYSYSLATETSSQTINFYLLNGMVFGIEAIDNNLTTALPVEQGDGELEKELYDAYFQAASQDDQEARAKVFELLPQADWSLYKGMGSTNQTDAKMDLFTWLWSKSDLSDAEMTAMMEAAATNLDGAYSEGFSYFYGEKFKVDPQHFLSLLSDIDSPARVNIIFYLAAELYLLADTPWQNTLSDLSSSQQQLLDQIMEKGDQLRSQHTVSE